MVVGCPKCKVKLKIDDARIKPEGLKIKCPKCSTVLMVRKPAAAPVAPVAPAAPKPQPAPQSAPQARPAAAPSTLKAPDAPQPIEAQAKELNPKKILVAHENAVVLEEVMGQLLENGYLVIPVPNGVDTLVQTMKELPFIVILDAALPKIDGYEIIKRLKEKDETKDIKCIVVSSKTDPVRQKKSPASMYGVNAYIDDDDIPDNMLKIMKFVISGQESASLPAPEPSPQPAPVAAPQPTPTPAPEPAPRPTPSTQPTAAVSPGPPANQGAEKARRLARTVLSDIDLYDPEKVLESIKTGKFEAIFGAELREGLKHYQIRIPKEVRAQGNFFQESLEAFVAKKKKILGI